MGLFDGLGGMKEEGSSYHLAETLGMPIVLVIDAHGMGRSIIPLIAGFLQYDKKKLIRGVILNRTSKMFFDTIAPLIEAELPVKVLGCMPNDGALSLSSRHLGLILPEEVEELNGQLERAGELLEKYVDLDAIIRIAKEAGTDGLLEEEKKRLGFSAKTEEPEREEADFWEKTAYGEKKENIEETETKVPKIAVAMDEAFCFYYRDNLKMLQYYGAELVPFSPLHDKKLPEGTSGLLLGGGYPELYAKELSENESMKASVREALQKGMPSLAECGGFMYLHERLTDQEGHTFPLAGAVTGTCSYKGKLVRFGYVEVSECDTECKKSGEEPEVSGFWLSGKTIKAHEFHYYDSTENGEDCVAVKPVTGRNWKCIHASEHTFWGYPHLYYPSNPDFVVRFLEQCSHYNKNNTDTLQNTDACVKIGKVS